jgi:hypothetical protein
MNPTADARRNPLTLRSLCHLGLLLAAAATACTDDGTSRFTPSDDAAVVDEGAADGATVGGGAALTTVLGATCGAMGVAASVAVDRSADVDDDVADPRFIAACGDRVVTTITLTAATAVSARPPTTQSARLFDPRATLSVETGVSVVKSRAGIDGARPTFVGSKTGVVPPVGSSGPRGMSAV